MDQSLGVSIEAWSDFHTFLGTAAFTLLGLLFVALSLRLNIFRRHALADVRDFALLTFANFLTLTIIALLFFIPSQSNIGLAVPFLVMGVLGVTAVALLVRESRLVNTGTYALTWSQVAWFSVCAVPYGGLTVLAVALLLDAANVFYWLAAVEISLLLISAFNTWLLLSRAQPDSGSGAPQQDS